jgi:hypothetical protein
MTSSFEEAELPKRTPKPIARPTRTPVYTPNSIGTAQQPAAPAAVRAAALFMPAALAKARPQAKRGKGK